jgi:hypothetical protein
MKKIIFGLVLCALVAMPISAMGAKTGDFELGGYIKLFADWNSTQVVNKNMGLVASRNNATYPSHDGRFRMTAQDTRFNFKIKGPEVWGAKTQGYIEMDFDGFPGQDAAAAVPVTNSYRPRLRHAWFRMDWEGGWRVLMGQYWGVFCNFWPDTVNSGPLFGHGMSTQRLPQIRVTKVAGPWTFDAFAGTPDSSAPGNNTVAFNDVWGSQILPGSLPGGISNNIGEAAVMPQFGLSALYEKDLWGKAGYFGRPRAFAANVVFGIQRTKYYGGGFAAPTWSQNADPTLPNGGGFGAVAGWQENQTLTPWCLQASLFIPIIPTKTENLKGTASIQLQGYIGQGLRFFGNGFNASNDYWVFDGFSNVGSYPLGVFPNVNPSGGAGNWTAGFPIYKRRLSREYGGYIQGQYYFNNAWYVSYLYGFSKKYGVPQHRDSSLQNYYFNLLGAGAANTNQSGYVWAGNFNIIRDIQEHNVTLFYRPVKAFKFGLSYAYINTNYFQISTVGSKQTRRGDNHRVQFAGWFFF